MESEVIFKAVSSEEAKASGFGNVISDFENSNNTETPSVSLSDLSNQILTLQNTITNLETQLLKYLNNSNI